MAGGKQRFHVTTVHDPLRAIVERLAQPGESCWELHVEPYR